MRMEGVPQSSAHALLPICPTLLPCSGDLDAVRHLARSGLDVFAHNVETVSRVACYVVQPFVEPRCQLSARLPVKMLLSAHHRAFRSQPACLTSACPFPTCCTLPSSPHPTHHPHTLHHPAPSRPQVDRLQKRVRDPRAGYIQSLEVLRAAKGCGVYTKSSIMLGLGEPGAFREGGRFARWPCPPCMRPRSCRALSGGRSACAQCPVQKQAVLVSARCAWAAGTAPGTVCDRPAMVLRKPEMVDACAP